MNGRFEELDAFGKKKFAVTKPDGFSGFTQEKKSFLSGIVEPESMDILFSSEDQDDFLDDDVEDEERFLGI